MHVCVLGDWHWVIGLGSSCWWSCEVEIGAAIPRPREKANNMLVPGDVIVIRWTDTYEKATPEGFLKERILARIEEIRNIASSWELCHFPVGTDCAHFPIPNRTRSYEEWPMIQKDTH